MSCQSPSSIERNMRIKFANSSPQELQPSCVQLIQDKLAGETFTDECLLAIHYVDGDPHLQFHRAFLKLPPVNAEVAKLDEAEMNKIISDLKAQVVRG